MELSVLLASPVVALTIVPVIAMLVQRLMLRYTKYMDKYWALKAVEAAPHVYEGARYSSIRTESGDADMCGPCTLTSLKLGRVEVVINETGHKMNWSVQEWLRLHPVYIPNAEA